MKTTRTMEGGGGSGGRIWSFVLGLLLIASQVGDATGNHATVQCVQLGQANTNAMKHEEYTTTHRDGPWTIGARKFDTKYIFLDFGVQNRMAVKKEQTCTETETYIPEICQKKLCSIYINPCPPDSEVEIRTYAVWQGDRVMTGWLHFEVELKDPAKYGGILAIYLQVRDEFFNAIGEFVTKPEEQCEPSISGLIQPSEYQILPCSAVGFREAKISYALFMADEEMLRIPSSVKFLPQERLNGSKGIHFTWRLSEYWCNRHLRFRPEAIIFTEKMARANNKNADPRILRKAASQWIHPHWYGAADIKLHGTTLNCSRKAIDYNYDSGTLYRENAPWLEKMTASVLSNDYLEADQWYGTGIYIPAPGYPPPGYEIGSMKSCQDETRKMQPFDSHKDDQQPGVPDYKQDKMPTFAGRCTHHYEKKPKHDALQGCNLDEKAEEFQDVLKKHPNIPTYKSYAIELFENRTKLCNVPCNPPNSTKDLENIQAFQDNSKVGANHDINIIRSNTSSLRNKFSFLLTGRRYHAVMGVVWSMFLMPVGIFMSRYFKETCMNKACSGIHLWYSVHVGCSIMAGVVFTSSLLGLYDSITTWGRTVHEMTSYHRLIGYASFSTFLLLLSFGWMRGLTIACRRAMMFLHTLLGFTVYILNNGVMILSAWIPASPTMGEDCEVDGTPKDWGKPVFVMVAWIGLDAVFQLLMTTLYCLTDKKYKIQRPCWFPLVPLMPFNSTKDYKGSFARRVIMLMYLGSAFILTNITIGLITTHQPNNTECLRRFNMTCDTDMNPYGCSKAALNYAKIIKSASYNR